MKESDTFRWDKVKCVQTNLTCNERSCCIVDFFWIFAIFAYLWRPIVTQRKKSFSASRLKKLRCMVSSLGFTHNQRGHVVAGPGHWQPKVSGRPGGYACSPGRGRRPTRWPSRTVGPRKPALNKIFTRPLQNYDSDCELNYSISLQLPRLHERPAQPDSRPRRLQNYMTRRQDSRSDSGCAIYLCECWLFKRWHITCSLVCIQCLPRMLWVIWAPHSHFISGNWNPNMLPHIEQWCSLLEGPWEDSC